MPSPRPVPAAPRLLLDETSETSVTVAWAAPPAGAGVAAVRLYVREFPRPWAEARAVDVPVAAGDALPPQAQAGLVVGGLFPTSTCELRLAYVFEDGSEGDCGPAVSADTLAAGCTPKAKADAKAKAAEGGKCAVA